MVKKKNIIKILSGLLIIMFLVSITIDVLAAGTFLPSTITGDEAKMGGKESLKTIGKGVIKVIQTIGSIISVCVLVVLGIKYMLGSVEEKAEYKKTMLPYIIGAFLVFTASVFSQILYNVFSTIRG